MNTLLIIVLLLLLIFSYLYKKTIFFPTFIFNFIWFLTIFLHSFQLSELQQVFSDKTCIIFLIAIISFNLVVYLYDFFHKKEKKLTLNIDINYKVLFIFKVIVFFVFFIEIIYSNGFPLLWKIFSINKTYMDFGIPSLNGMFLGLVILLGSYSIVKRKKEAILYLGIGVLLLSRQVILSMILEAIVINLIFYVKKIPWLKLGTLGIIILLGFSFLGNIRSGNDEIDRVFMAKPQFENIPKSLKWSYSYITFSLSNFNNLTSKTDGNVNGGISTLKEFLPTIILHRLNLVENYRTNYLILPNFTVSTYLPSAYLDFGVTGILLLNIIIALFCIYFYEKAFKNKNLKNCMYYSICVHNLIFLLFNNMFLYLPGMIQFIYIYLLFYQKKKIVCNSEKEFLNKNKNTEFLNKIGSEYYCIINKFTNKEYLIYNQKVNLIIANKFEFPEEMLNIEDKRNRVIYLFLYYYIYNVGFLPFELKKFISDELNCITSKKCLLWSTAEIKEYLDKYLLLNNCYDNKIIRIKRHLFKYHIFRKMESLLIKLCFFSKRICYIFFLRPHKKLKKKYNLQNIKYFKTNFHLSLNDTIILKAKKDNEYYFIKGFDSFRSQCREKECLESLNSLTTNDNYLREYELNDKLFICTEYCKWLNLEEYKNMYSFNKEDIVALIDFCVQICQDLKIKNIIHRDIRPQNILVQKNHNKIKFKLIDFGSAILNGNSNINICDYKTFLINKALGDHYKPNLFEWNDVISAIQMIEEICPSCYTDYASKMQIIIQQI